MMQLLPTDDKTVVCLGHDRQPYGPGQLPYGPCQCPLWTISVSPLDHVSDHMDRVSVPNGPCQCPIRTRSVSPTDHVSLSCGPGL